MNTNKERYRKWCEQDKTMPFFYRYDYYQAIYGANWDVALATNGIDIQAAMPYAIRKKKGFNLILPEPLMPYQGIWINYPPNQKYASKLGFEKEVITKIIEQLPSVALFRQQFHPNFTNWLPFAWKNYTQTTKYSYIIEDLTDLERVFEDFSSKLRGHIRKAEKKISISKSEDINLFYTMKTASAKAKSITFNISKKHFETLYHYYTKNNCGELLTATDEVGNVHSMFFYFWDCFSAYGVTSVTDDKYKNESSMSLLYWEAIKRASKNTKSFNFNGGNIESIETFFRSFGGKQTPYFEINKTNHPLLKLLRY